MKGLFENYTLPENPTQNKCNSERASIIKEFVDRINLTRPCVYEVNGKKKKLEKITPRAVAVKVGHIKSNSDLYYFLSICKQGKSFSKTFFGSIKAVEKSA